MKSNYLLLLWLLSSFFAVSVAQTGSKPVVVSELVVLSWQSDRPLPNDKGFVQNYPDFKEAIRLSGYKNLPIWHISLGNKIINQWKIIDLVYDTVNLAVVSAQELAFIKSAPVCEPQVYIQRKISYSQMYVLPFRINPITHKAEKLISFRYTAHLLDPQKLNKTTAGDQEWKTTSVLAAGEWFKIGINKTGIHKITPAYLRSLGMNTSGLDPRNLAIFGNGIGMLPMANSSNRTDDLAQNRIWVAGQEDARFDESDYILFYAQGPDTWQYQAAENQFAHQKNLYSDTTYYFITLQSDARGLRINQDAASLPAPSATFAHFQYRAFHEQNTTNFLASGKRWYGEMFGAQKRFQFDFAAPGLLADSMAHIRVEALGACYQTSGSLATTINNNLMPNSIGFGKLDAGALYAPAGSINEQSYHIVPPNTASGNISVALEFKNNGDNNAKAYLDYISVNALCKLELYNNQTEFRHSGSINYQISRFQMPGAAGLRVWQIGNAGQMLEMKLKSAAGNNLYFDAATADTLREFIAFSGSNFPAPLPGSRLPNQNLHAISGIDLLIITHPNFRAEAERLATLRRNADGLNVALATTSQVYNEFSSGAQDLSAIRDLARMIYKRDASNRFRYLLLFGDASFDYKSKNTSNSNYVPVFESDESNLALYSFCSDDYVALLDDQEGNWRDNSNSFMDIGVGRLPIRSIQEAKIIVDKLTNYASKKTMGRWRNQITMVCDNGGENFIGDAETVINQIESRRPAYVINKIYISAFPKVARASSFIVPLANQALNAAIDKTGSLIVNYTGHGSTSIWADEQLLTIEQINSWTNHNQLPFFVTATCDFGRYDNSEILASGGEQLLLSPHGAGIGLLTASRLVFQNTNLAMNSEFNKFTFTAMPDGQMPRLGDIMMKAKNTTTSGSSNKSYALLADPSMRLAYPEESANIVSVNGKLLTDKDTLRGLGRIMIDGVIKSKSGTLLSGFDGVAYITVYDKPTNVRGRNGSYTYNFNMRSNIIFNGTALVKNGAFTTRFVVPKDISYSYGQGSVVVYAMDTTSLKIDAHGVSNDIVIGGLNSDALPDDVPPLIKLYINDTTFRDGGLSHADPLLIANLSDENGLNVSSMGIGHEMIGNISTDLQNPLMLNNFYLTEPNTYKKGTIKYRLNDMPAGRHTFALKAWDTYNNSADAKISFLIVDSKELKLIGVGNYPNPFSDNTFFTFQHNQAGQNLKVQLQVFTSTGAKLLDRQISIDNSNAQIGENKEIGWDGRGQDGQLVKTGMYYYRLTVQSPDGKTASTGTLVYVR